VKNSQYRAFDPDLDSRYPDQHGMTDVPGAIRTTATSRGARQLAARRGPSARVWDEANVKARCRPKRSGSGPRARGARRATGGRLNDDSRSGPIWPTSRCAGRTRRQVIRNRIQKRQPYRMRWATRGRGALQRQCTAWTIRAGGAERWGLYTWWATSERVDAQQLRLYPTRRTMPQRRRCGELKVARGGSFRDAARTPARLSARVRSWQAVYDVGIRS
jgi:hypothetical protein